MSDGQTPTAPIVVRPKEGEASDARFRGLLESAPDAVVIVDAYGVIELINGQTERMFGYSRAELIGKPIEMLLPARYRERHVHHRAHYALEPRARAMGAELSLHALRKDGSELPVEISLSPLAAEPGVVIAAIRDVTERRKAEEQRFRLAAIVDSSGDAIIGQTLDGVITSWNEGAERMFGYAAHEIVGRSANTFIPADRYEEEAEILRKLASGEQLDQIDTVRLAKDGSLVYVSMSTSPVRDAEGRLVAASKIARDMSKRMRAERALALAKDAAEAANRELEAFSYSVAHDLRAPLRAIRSFSDLLLAMHREHLDAEGQDWLQEIAGNAHKMSELIDGLLSLARTSRGDLSRVDIDLSAVATEVGARLAASQPTRSVSVRIEPGLVVSADPRLLRALLENLLGNAWKFTQRVPAASIEVGAEDREDGRVLFVRDNGAGFDMAYASKLFGPFQRLHNAAEFPGTGIGLATVQRIVRRHGGRIWAEGATGRGATFYFSLPTDSSERLS